MQKGQGPGCCLCWQDNAGKNIFIIQWDRVSSTGAVELILPCFVWVWYKCYEILCNYLVGYMGSMYKKG